MGVVRGVIPVDIGAITATGVRPVPPSIMDSKFRPSPLRPFEGVSMEMPNSETDPREFGCPPKASDVGLCGLEEGAGLALGAASSHESTGSSLMLREGERGVP